MKLTEYLIRTAFAAESWPCAIAALEIEFGTKVPVDCVEFSIKRYRDSYDELLVIAGNGDTYEWSDATGFVFTPMLVGGLPSRISDPDIVIYKAC